MRNHPIYLSKIIFICIAFLNFFGVCNAGSLTLQHKIGNGSKEDIVVTIFELYPVNDVHSNALKPGEFLEFKSEMEVPYKFLLVTITRDFRKDRQGVLLRKMFSLDDYYKQYKDYEGNAMIITEKDFETLEK